MTSYTVHLCESRTGNCTPIMLGWWLATLCSLTNQQCPPLCCHYSSGDTIQATTKPHQYPSKLRFISLASSLHHYKTPSLPFVIFPVSCWHLEVHYIVAIAQMLCCCFTVVLSMEKEPTYIQTKSVHVVLIVAKKDWWVQRGKWQQAEVLTHIHGVSVRLSADKHVSYLQEYVGGLARTLTQITSLFLAESSMEAHLSLASSFCQ